VKFVGMFTSILQKELHFHTVHKKLYVRKILRLYMPEVAMRRSSVKLDGHWLLVAIVEWPTSFLVTWHILTLKMRLWCYKSKWTKNDESVSLFLITMSFDTENKHQASIEKVPYRSLWSSLCEDTYELKLTRISL